jgi:hypothetical protein
MLVLAIQARFTFTYSSLRPASMSSPRWVEFPPSLQDSTYGAVHNHVHMYSLTCRQADTQVGSPPLQDSTYAVHTHMYSLTCRQAGTQVGSRPSLHRKSYC